ncbi:MAG TPA: TIGR02391 family protein [Vicinamibacterales bacterium]|jgi:uncharacterized protein (TIGR02391 family)|nr:TIGR02391 family protein [Vicinamibacterales bacterium]
MDEDELELALAERFLAQHKAGEIADPKRTSKCARELDLRELLRELTGDEGASLDYETDSWLRRLTSPRRGGHAPLKRCTDSTKNAGEHKFHLRAYFEDSGLPASEWAGKLREIARQSGRLQMRARKPNPKVVTVNEFWRILHPAIVKVARQRFESNHFADAVEASSKEVNQAVKARVLTSTRQEYDGTDLMNRAFSVEKPVVVLADLSTQSGKDEQVGYMQLFAGAMRGIRNPKAHANIEIDDVRAIHHLFVASLLMSKLDEAG